jgi:hypothetical protein
MENYIAKKKVSRKMSYPKGICSLVIKRFYVHRLLCDQIHNRDAQMPLKKDSF